MFDARNRHRRIDAEVVSQGGRGDGRREVVNAQAAGLPAGEGGALGGWRHGPGRGR